MRQIGFNDWTRHNKTAGQRRFDSEAVELKIQRQSMKKVTLVVSISVLLATTAVAQDIKTELTGTIEIDGSSTVAPISTEAAVMFG